MISDFDKYFQMVFFNEHSISDRPLREFYQIKIEMSFATNLCLHVLYRCFFVRVSYEDTMLKYGSD